MVCFCISKVVMQCMRQVLDEKITHGQKQNLPHTGNLIYMH